MEIVVNDTNIFIDLISVGLLEDFFQLPVKVHTVDFVISEIKDENQSKAVREFINNGNLTIKGFSAKEMQAIYTLKSTAGGNLSVTDCSVWHYAKENDYILLTGDRQLKDKAILSNVKVKGILYVFDQLVELNIITCQRAAECLQNLLAINPRLPKKLIQELIDRWQ